MLIAEYNESDAYWDEDEVAEMKIEDPEGNEFLEPGYQDDLDQMYYDDFKYGVRHAFEKRKFPLVLVARKSNWRGSDGYAKAEDIDEVLSKIFSFDNTNMELHRTRGGALHFSTGSHDVPMGFIIEVKPFNKTYWS
jgi:hypothetical protein